MVAAAFLNYGYLNFSTSPMSFESKVAIFLLNFAMIGQIINKWQLIFEIRWLPSWIMVTWIFLHRRCVLNQSSNIPTKFGNDMSNSNWNGNHYLKFQMAATAILNFETKHFWRHVYVPNRSPIVFTNFGDDRSNSKEMASFSKSKMATAAILNYGYVDFSTSPVCFKSK